MLTSPLRHDPRHYLCRKEGRGVRPRRVGAGERERAACGWRRRHRLGRQCRHHRQGDQRRYSHRRPARDRLAQDCGPSAGARRPADASGSALVGRLRRHRGCRGDRRHRTVLPRAARARAGGAVRRHHRHQRQVDDDGADRASPGVGGFRRPARRQYRHRDPVARSPRVGPRPRDRVLVLPDRSRALARSLGRYPAQRH